MLSVLKINLGMFVSLVSEWNERCSQKLKGFMRYENEFECIDLVKWFESYKEIIC